MALYNNGYPMTYQQYYPNAYPTQSNNYPTQISVGAQQPQSGIIWVQGEAGAKSYLVAPNTTVQLWDSESQTIYLKSADASGMPSMRILDYIIRDSEKSLKMPPASSQSYVTKDELDAQISELKNQIDILRKGKKNESTVQFNESRKQSKRIDAEL